MVLCFSLGHLINRVTWLCTLNEGGEEPLNMQSGAFVTLMSLQFSLPSPREEANVRWMRMSNRLKNVFSG